MEGIGNDMELAQVRRSCHECWYAFLVDGANEACRSLCAEFVKCKAVPLEFLFVDCVNVVFPERRPEI